MVNPDEWMAVNRLSFADSTDVTDEIRLFWLKVVKSHTNDYVLTSRTHHHNFFELHFVLCGRIRYCVDGRSIAVGANQYMVIAPGTEHAVLAYSDDFVKLSIGAMGKEERVHAQLQKHSGLKAKTTAEMKEALRFIRRQAAENNFYSLKLIKNRIFELACLILGTCEQEKTALNRTAGTDERLVLAKQIIAKQDDTLLKAREIAAACHISVKQLERIFKKYEGKTLLAYIHDAKIAQAQKRLIESGDTLKKISEALGFSNEYYFNLFFKKKTGMTPGDYRKTKPEC